MKKFITPTYTFTPGISGVGTVNLSGIDSFNIKNLVSIINQTKGVVIYATGSQTLKYTNVSGTTVTLFFDTTGMSSGDTLQVIYEDNSALEVIPSVTTPEGAIVSGNIIDEISEDFCDTLDTNVWDVSYLNQGSTFYAIGGEALGSSYLKVSMCPYTVGSQFLLTSKQTFSLPVALKYSYSASKRMFGNQLEIGVASVDANGDIEYITAKPDVALPATLSVVSNVAIVVFANNHSFVTGDRVVLSGNSDTRLNCPPTYVDVVDEKTIVFALTVANATYSCDGFIRYVDSLSDVKSGMNFYIGDSITVTNVTLSSRNKGKSARRENLFVSTSVAQSDDFSFFSDNFRPTNEQTAKLQNDKLTVTTQGFENVGTFYGTTKLSQNIPSPDQRYKLFIRAKNLASMSRPVGKIVLATKSGTNIATITTDVPHGLTPTSKVNIIGIRSGAFGNIVTPTQVTSIVNSTQFTIPLGGAQTVSSAGGRVDVCENDKIIVNGAYGARVQSISRTGNILSISCFDSSNFASLAPGETIELYGCDATSMGLYDGSYIVGSASGGVIKVKSIGSDFASINCGGSVLKRTDFRIHQLKFADYSKTLVNLDDLGDNDFNNSMTVKGTIQISDTQSVLPVSISDTINTSVTNTVNITDADGFTFPVSLTPISPIVGTTTTGTFFNSKSSFLRMILQVTAFSGTGVAKITLQERFGTLSFRDVYTFESIDGLKTLVSPIFPSSSNEYRFRAEVQSGVSLTITPNYQSFKSGNSYPFAQQVLNTADINLNTLGSAGPSVFIGDCSKVMLAGVITSQSAPATLEVQFSTNGTNWFSSPGTIATVAGVVQLKKDSELWNYARVRVSTAGTSVVLKEIVLRGM